MPSSSAISGLHVVLTAHDSMRTIEHTLASVRDLAERVLVVDSGSTDGTIEACRAAGAEVVHRPWSGYVAQRQAAMEWSAAPSSGAPPRWVLLLDSDEAVEPALAESMRRTLAGDDPAIAGYEINRKLWFHGAWLHHVFQPEWRLRLVRAALVRAGGVRAVGRVPHDALEADGRVARLAGDLRHDSWLNAHDMLRRQVAYARLSAEAGAGGGTLAHVMVSPAAAFLKQFVLRGGWLDGWRGAVCAGGAAAATLMKHVCVMERRRSDTAR
ncbi:MAG: glycosyltransferase family 2 protein [Phycisphaerales bacterium]